MTLNIRRVVTGHDADGRSVVKMDAIAENIVSRREGHSSVLLWTTDQSPADNAGDFDAGSRTIGASVAGGTVFRIARYDPGVKPRNHRTNSVDYAIVLSGEIEMELDDQVVVLKAGDTLVQRGTVHNWANRGTEPCIIAFVLVDAEPVVAGDETLGPSG